MPSALEAALRRLLAAVERVEQAVGARLDDETRLGEVESELHRIGSDRSRLAQSLDAAEARAARLEEANRDVGRRLVAAMESIRGVLDRNQA
ncbi:MAG TPA: DUF4164 domain-containing protein [Bauldia sp.]|nr:DUF4164 domain-containing protein [Bauldia sp.]